MASPLRVTFVFASVGIGGAERSMLRMMQAAHPHTLNCQVIFVGDENPEFKMALSASQIPFYSIKRFDVSELVRQFKGFGTDVAYLFGQIRSLPWILAARLAKVGMVVGAERSAVVRRIDRVGRFIDRWLLDDFICNSQRAYDALRQELGIPANRLHLIYNGLELSQLTGDGDILDSDLGQPSILCIANLLPQKGHLVLLDAIWQLRPEYPNIRAVLLGKDQMQGRFFVETATHQLTDFYTYCGFVHNVFPYLKRAQVLVLPSLEYEGTSTALLEAMAFCVPVVATNVGGTKELIKHGQTGLLAPPGDSAALAAALRQLLSSPDLRQQLTDNAYEMIRQHHTMEAMVDEHVNVFRQGLSARGKA